MAGNLEVTDLPLIPAVDGADVYGAKNNLDYRIRTGEAGGLATLNGSGDVPATQLPIGVANGVAGLDGSTKVPIAQLPAGTANGVASLDGTGKVPAAQLDVNTILSDAVRKSVGGIQVLASALASPTGYATRSARDGGVKVSVQDATGATTYGGLTNDSTGVGLQNSVSSKRLIIRDDGFSRLNGPLSIFDGAFGSEVGFIQMGWNNNIRLWQQSILASGNWTLYGYDGSGGSQTAQIICNRGVSTTFNGSVIASGGFQPSSSIKVKEEMEPVAGSLEKIENLVFVTGKYKKDFVDCEGEARRKYFALAEQAETITPELVTPGVFEYKGEKIPSFDYDGLAVLASAAIQELSQQVKELQRQLDELKKA